MAPNLDPGGLPLNGGLKPPEAQPGPEVTADKDKTQDVGQSKKVAESGGQSREEGKDGDYEDEIGPFQRLRSLRSSPLLLKRYETISARGMRKASTEHDGFQDLSHPRASAPGTGTC